ncbi:unnamed protein product, partial [Agarophyton chilense]
SDRGWTRGMPPPSPRRPVLVSRPRFHATLSEPNPRVKPHHQHQQHQQQQQQQQQHHQQQQQQQQQQQHNDHDDSITVEAYVSDATTPPQPDRLHALLRDTDAFHPARAVVHNAREQTRSVHGGERVRAAKHVRALLDAVQTPIVQSATFTFGSTRDCIDYNRGRYPSFEYGRYGNPTTRAVEEKLMALERAEDCLLSSCGMNAVTTMLLALLPQHGHVVVTTDCYRRTRQFVDTLLPKMAIRSTVLDPADLHTLERVLRTDHVDLYFSESPTNPMMRVVDVPRIAALCRAHGAVSVFDSTFATPINIRPLELGADLVLHSGTKYLAGHHDVLCGALAGRADLIASVRKLHGVLGGVIDPHAAFLVNRGLKTLGVRMQAHNRNATAIADLLSTHHKVARVHFPTLQSHPDYATACALFERGAFGGVLSFELVGDGDAWSRATFEAAGRFVDALQIAYIGPSMGGCETMVEQVCIMGYFDQPLRERKRLGISNGLVRMACGIEDVNDLVADVAAALDAA